MAIAEANLQEKASGQWEEARTRIRELLAQDPDFAEECRVAMAGSGPVDDELLARARAGEFGDEVFSHRYGKKAAEVLKSRIRG